MKASGAMKMVANIWRYATKTNGLNPCDNATLLKRVTLAVIPCNTTIAIMALCLPINPPIFFNNVVVFASENHSLFAASYRNNKFVNITNVSLRFL